MKIPSYNDQVIKALKDDQLNRWKMRALIFMGVSVPLLLFLSMQSFQRVEQQVEVLAKYVGAEASLFVEVKE